LPEQPFVDGDTCALVARIELAGLAAEILQNGAGFEDRIGRPPGPFGSRMAGIRSFGEIAKNCGENCSPFEMSTGRTT
jgi:hypothetical protein